MEKRRGAQRVLVKKLKEKDHFEDLEVDERLIINGSSRTGMKGRGLG
jgi:hypothetical protein